MQRRGLPLAYVLTAGNQAQLRLSDLAARLVEDKRVTAIGLHIEGIGDLAAFEAMAEVAHRAGVPIVALKIGRSEAAQTAAISHTASLAGSAAGASALLRRLGIAEVTSVEALLETLKLLHQSGPLRSRRVASLSCSGGEAGLMADTLVAKGLETPALGAGQKEALGAVLGPKVALANPLDFHTYIWNNPPAIAATFTAMMQGEADLGLVVSDFPRGDRCFQGDWEPVIDGTRAAKEATGAPMAILSVLPENLPEDICVRLMEQGITPLCGVEAGLDAVAAAAELGVARRAQDALWPPGAARRSGVLSEAAGKAALSAYGVAVPRSQVLARAALGTATP
jgi:acyl-CoA synthetase (NDP forming)